MSDITQNQKSMKKFYDDISEKYDLIFSLSPLHKTFFAEEIKGKKVRFYYNMSIRMKYQ